MKRALSSGMRLIRMRPLFSTAIVATLAIAIGAASAVFSVVDKLLIRPLPFPDAGRIVYVKNSWPLFVDGVDGEPTSAADDAFHRLARYEMGRVGAGLTELRVVRVAQVSGGFFEILGVRPAAGGALSRDAFANSRNGVVLSAELSRSFFNDSAAAALGQFLTINGRRYVVMGVMPAGFSFQVRGRAVDAWVPFHEDGLFDVQQTEGSGAIARLKAELSFDEAQSRTDVAFTQLARARPELRLRDNDRMQIMRLRDHWFGSLRGPLLMLLGAAGCLVLIACANVTGLMLARAAARERDSAIRAVLGASQRDLVGEALAESAALGILATAAGLLIALWGAEVMLAVSPVLLPTDLLLGPDLRMFAFALIVALVASCTAGAISAWRAARRDPWRALVAAPHNGVFLASRMRQTLVIAQIAISVMLLVNAGLLVRSFRALRFESTGFDARNILTMEIATTAPHFADARSRVAYYEQILDGLRSTPGVEQAAMVNFLPLYSGSLIVPISTPELAGSDSPTLTYRAATPGYFTSLRIPLLAGREFNAGDRLNAPLVAILDHSAATLLGGGVAGSVIGKRITVTSGTPTTYEIVGVVGDIRQQGLGIQAYPGFYLSAYQRPPSVVHVVARTASDPRAVSDGVRTALRRVDATLPVGSLSLLDTRVSDTVSRRRFAVVLSSVLGAIALILSVVGLFALMSEFVLHHLREIGVRVAMGAQPTDIFRLVLRQGGALAAIGIAAGLAAAFTASSLVASLLYGIGRFDPLTFAAVPSLVIVVALVACCVPAVRALRANPVDVLRWQ